MPPLPHWSQRMGDSIKICRSYCNWTYLPPHIRVAVSSRHMLLLLPLFIVCPPISNWMRACQNKMAFCHDPRVWGRNWNSPSPLSNTVIIRRRSDPTAVILSPLLYCQVALRPGVRYVPFKWIMDLIMRQCSRNKFQPLLRLIVKWTKRRDVKNEEPSSIVGSICGAAGMHRMIFLPLYPCQNNCKSLRMILCIGYIQEEATWKRVRARTKLIQIESVRSV